VQKSEVKDFWEYFLENIDIIQNIVAEDEEFKEFVGDVHLSSKFP
jgi:hypothetical protein